MKWLDFEREIKRKNITLFTPLDVQRFLGRSKMASQFLVYRLKKKGYVVSVKRGLYKLSDEQIPDLYVANKIYSPSYISLEFALSYHGIIPETVYEITSVTTKATRRFKTLGKIFSFRKIKKVAYTGYEIQKQQGLSFYIADAEKAFVDTDYLRLMSGQKPISRFDKAKINRAKALRYAKLFKNEKLIGVVKTTLQ
jgi:predicted transcriptional regulator of viral defense system